MLECITMISIMVWKLTPKITGDKIMLSFEIEANSFGALFASNAFPDSAMSSLMLKMKAMTDTSLSYHSDEWKVLPQQDRKDFADKNSKRFTGRNDQDSSGDYLFRVSGIEIEGFDDNGVDVQYPWEDSPRRFHQHFMQIQSFWMDRFPVTNKQFKQFLDSAHYHPKDDLNFLRDWKDGSYPEGSGKVSLLPGSLLRMHAPMPHGLENVCPMNGNGMTLLRE